MRSKQAIQWLAGAVATLAICLAGCTPSTVARDNQPPTPATQTPMPPLALSPTPTVALMPSPVPSVLAPLPADCPTIDPPHTLTLTQPIVVPEDRGTYPAGTILVGSSPLWLFSYGPVHQNRDGQVTPWPSLKIQILVEPSYRDYAVLQIANVRTGELLLFNLSGHFPPELPSELTPVDVFDLRGTSTTQWKELKAFPFVPQAGCYRLTAQWDGGGWSTTFGVGR